MIDGSILNLEIIIKNYFFNIYRIQQDLKLQKKAQSYHILQILIFTRINIVIYHTS